MMGFNRRTPWQCKTAALARLWRQKGVNVLVTSGIRPPYRYLSGGAWAWGLARRDVFVLRRSTRPSVRLRDTKDVAGAAATLHVPRSIARTAGTAKKTGCRHSTW